MVDSSKNTFTNSRTHILIVLSSATDSSVEVGDRGGEERYDGTRRCRRTGRFNAKVNKP